MNAQQTFKSAVSDKTDKPRDVSDYLKPHWALDKKVQLPSTDETDRKQEILPDGDPPPVILWGTDR